MKEPQKRHETLSASDVETMLRASAAWEPDAPPPHDFAAFTRRALEKPERTPWARRMGGAGGMRSPLAVGLASACVLWLGGKLNPSQETVTNPVSVSYAASASVSGYMPTRESLPPSPHLTLAANDTSEPMQAAAPQQTARLSDYRTAAATRNSVSGNSRRSRSKTSAARPLWRTETVSVKPSTKGSVAKNPLWETETVERPAWGALVPVPTAADCALPATDEQTGEEASEPAEGEASSAILPLVLDVALPDMEPPMPVPSPSPTPQAPLPPNNGGF